MIYIFYFVLIVYAISIGVLLYGFDKVNTRANICVIPKTNFSIIVPFRNESANFLNLLDSISALNYPKNLFDLIAINDDSDDQSVQIFKLWHSKNKTISARLIQNVRTSNSPKKDAISTAISIIDKEWIITTDADCHVQPNWLAAFDDYIQSTNAEMLVGAVSIKKTKGFLNYFQFIDLLSLQGTTIGSFGINKPFMCNGANFGYTRKLFVALNGFNGNNKIASGDDVFLLQKAIKQNPKKVHYLKNTDSIVFTKSEDSWNKLFHQRVRWASKTGSYDSFFGKSLAVVVFAMNLSILLSFYFLSLPSIIFLIVIKFFTDYLLLHKTNNFLHKQVFVFPVFSSLFYPFFCVAVAFYSFFGNYKWKNRTFKK